MTPLLGMIVKVQWKPLVPIAIYFKFLLFIDQQWHCHA